MSCVPPPSVLQQSHNNNLINNVNVSELCTQLAQNLANLNNKFDQLTTIVTELKAQNTASYNTNVNHVAPQNASYYEERPWIDEHIGAHAPGPRHQHMTSRQHDGQPSHQPRRDIGGWRTAAVTQQAPRVT